MLEVVDDRGTQVTLPSPPRRIVSLVPSSTETLFDLGVGPAVVGVTRFCTRPADAVADLPRVGGTKDPDLDRIARLAPDLVVANCEENTREALDALAEVAPVYAAFPRTVDAALDDLVRLGTLVGRPAEAAAWRARIEADRATLAPRVAARSPRRVATLIWRRPWMALGADTFASDLLSRLGLHQALAHLDGRYPTVDAAQLRAADPDLVLLSSEPFPFRARHADELAAATGLPRARFRAVDGEALTWHGTRMAHALPALGHLLPDLLPVPA
ncbi:MAG: ABC transporter substrate-binding protein [Alphaproteobacteria bacterium]|nr:ABC transporter substrate-binding protein [Alphaproteobacteria bacterium]